METLPRAFYRIELRANFWEAPHQFPPMFGGAFEELQQHLPKGSSEWDLSSQE